MAAGRRLSGSTIYWRYVRLSTDKDGENQSCGQCEGELHGRRQDLFFLPQRYNVEHKRAIESVWHYYASWTHDNLSYLSGKERTSDSNEQGLASVGTGRWVEK